MGSGIVPEDRVTISVPQKEANPEVTAGFLGSIHGFFGKNWSSTCRKSMFSISGRNSKPPATFIGPIGRPRHFRRDKC
jgi:hypothetical protein